MKNFRSMKTNVTSHAFQHISDLKFCSECFRGALKTLWRATCSPRACSWTTLTESNHTYTVFLYTAWLVIYASLWKYA